MAGASRVILTILIVGIAGFTPFSVSAETYFYDGFFEYGIGELGDDNNSEWEGDILDVLVTDTDYYQPFSSITPDGINVNFSIEHVFSMSFSSSTDYILSATYKSSSTESSGPVILGISNGTGANLCWIKRLLTSGIYLDSSANGSQVFLGYLATSTWMKFDIRLDIDGAQCYARINGGEWSSASAVDTTGNASFAIATTTRRAHIGGGTAEDEGTSFWDEIILYSTNSVSATDPYVTYNYPQDQTNVEDLNPIFNTIIYDPGNDDPDFAQIWLIETFNNGQTSETIYLDEDYALNGSGPWSINIPLQLSNNKFYSYSVIPYTSDNIRWSNNGIHFNTGTTTFYSAFQEQYGNGLFATTTAVCNGPSSILDVGGGITYGLCIMFIPSSTVLNQFTSIPTKLAEKFPFDYIAGLEDVYSAITSQSASTTPDISVTVPIVGTVTLFDPDHIVASTTVLTTVRNYMGYAIYLFFGLFAPLKIAKLL